MNEKGKKSKVIELYSMTLIDVICTVVSFCVAAFFRSCYNVNGPLDKDSALIACFLLVLSSMLINMLTDNYRDFFKRSSYMELSVVAKNTVIILITTLMLMFFISTSQNLSRMVLAVFALINVVLSYVVHMWYKKYMLKHYEKNGVGSQVLVITSSDRGTTLMEQLKLDMPWNAKLVAACVMDAKKTGYDMNGLQVVANAENLYDVAGKMALDEVLIDLPDYPVDKLRQLVSDLQQMGIVCNCCIHVFSVEGSEKMISNFGRKPVVSYQKTAIDFRREVVKRIIDVCGAIVGLLITAVITPFIVLAIKAESPGPAIFAQERVGKNGRRFKIYKFRSMYMDAEERKKELLKQNQMNGLMFKMEDDPRITKVGKFIRKTSIDELPQFYNILIGQMSLVGTRPPTLDEFNEYNLHYKRRLSMTPGLTGMWQVSGRSEITDFDEVVKLDLEYIDNWSIGLDIKILFMTVASVLFSKGAV